MSLLLIKKIDENILLTSTEQLRISLNLTRDEELLKKNL